MRILYNKGYEKHLLIASPGWEHDHDVASLEFLAIDRQPLQLGLYSASTTDQKIGHELLNMTMIEFLHEKWSLTLDFLYLIWVLFHIVFISV